LRAMFSLGAVALMFLSPCVARADATPLPLTEIGVGSHGYDFIAGFWKCESAGDDIEHPTHTYIYATRSGMANAVVLVWESSWGQATQTLSYDAKTNVWTATFAGEPDPNVGVQQDAKFLKPLYGEVYSHGSESTSDSGPRTVWSGVGVFPGNAHRPIRDTWTFASLTQLEDITEEQIDGKWTMWDADKCVKQ